MPPTDLERELRPATLDDARLVADLESLRDPSEPRDPVLLRYWWQMSDELGRAMRLIGVRDGAAVAFLGASHDPWADGEKRFGVVRSMIRADEWNGAGYERLITLGQDWLRSEGAQVAVVRVSEDKTDELEVLERLGYRESRRLRTSELDLVARRDQLMAAARTTKERLLEQGVVMHPLSEDPDPDALYKLYLLMLESGHDIPRSMPDHEMTFDEWRRFWLDNPAIRQERFWIAREGDDVLGCSVLDCPVVRGVPVTAHTGTLRKARGRGIARALKYQSIAQAIEAGYTRVRTNNDADNPAILRINAEMGYHLVRPMMELHCAL